MSPEGQQPSAREQLKEELLDAAWANERARNNADRLFLVALAVTAAVGTYLVYKTLTEDRERQAR